MFTHIYCTCSRLFAELLGKVQVTADGVHGHVRLQEGRGMASDISQISQVQLAGLEGLPAGLSCVHFKSTADEVAPCRPPTAVRLLRIEDSSGASVRANFSEFSLGYRTWRKYGNMMKHECTF